MRRLVGANWGAGLRSRVAASAAVAPFAFHQQQQRWVVIEASSTPNPECTRFYSMELSFLPHGKSLEFVNTEQAHKSPLAALLFSVEGVRGVYLADEYITVTKRADVDWGDLSPLIKESVASFTDSGRSILSEEAAAELAECANDKDTEPQPEDDEVVLAIKELLASRIRPMVQADGGNVRYVGIDDGTVYVMLEGACKTCPSSGATLKNGIERMLMHWIPEVVEALEVDDEFAADFRRQREEVKKAKAASAAAAAKTA